MKRESIFLLVNEQTFDLKTKCHIYTKAEVQNKNLLERASLYGIEIVGRSKI